MSQDEQRNLLANVKWFDEQHLAGRAGRFQPLGANRGV